MTLDIKAIEAELAAVNTVAGFLDWNIHSPARVRNLLARVKELEERLRGIDDQRREDLMRGRISDD